MATWEEGQEEAQRQSRNRVFGGIRPINAEGAPVTDYSSRPNAGQPNVSPYANIRTGGGMGGIAPNYGIQESRYSAGGNAQAGGGFGSIVNSAASPSSSRAMRRSARGQSVDNSNNSTNDSGNVTVQFGNQSIDQSVSGNTISGGTTIGGGGITTPRVTVGSGNVASNEQRYGDTTTYNTRGGATRQAAPQAGAPQEPAAQGRRPRFPFFNRGAGRPDAALTPQSDVEGLAERLTGRPNTPRTVDPTQVMPSDMQARAGYNDITTEMARPTSGSSPIPEVTDVPPEVTREVQNIMGKTPAPAPQSNELPMVDPNVVNNNKTTPAADVPPAAKPAKKEHKPKAEETGTPNKKHGPPSPKGSKTNSGRGGVGARSDVAPIPAVEEKPAEKEAAPKAEATPTPAPKNRPKGRVVETDNGPEWVEDK